MEKSSQELKLDLDQLRARRDLLHAEIERASQRFQLVLQQEARADARIPPLAPAVQFSQWNNNGHNCDLPDELAAIR